MQRIPTLKIATTDGKANALLGAVKSALGAELNIFGAMANAPAVLEGYLGFNKALGSGTLPAQLREQLALTTAGYNGCNYCASAHTFMGSRQGLSKEETTANLSGTASDGKVQAALDFARKVIDNRGHVADSDVDTIRQAGFTDEELVEIVAHVALNTFTNYFNEVFKTDIDFPVVETHPVRKSA
ncbi:MAG: carboxymuconolactone decarboxylase family protein [Proteobacteria bacterium]|nr:carboxymuconolactone decarboxylase family protein [Pseudomonadota bacterium]